MVLCRRQKCALYNRSWRMWRGNGKFWWMLEQQLASRQRPQSPVLG
jgi:hypothetical protein